MLTIDVLKEYGADVNAGLTRCLNNETFYLGLVGRALDDPSFEKLDAAVATNDIKAIFEISHTLKGVLGNLSLTPLFDIASEMTELARSGESADYAAYLARLMEKRKAIQELAK